MWEIPKRQNAGAAKGGLTAWRGAGFEGRAPTGLGHAPWRRGCCPAGPWVWGWWSWLCEGGTPANRTCGRRKRQGLPAHPRPKSRMGKVGLTSQPRKPQAQNQAQPIVRCWRCTRACPPHLCFVHKASVKFFFLCLCSVHLRAGVFWQVLRV